MFDVEAFILVGGQSRRMGRDKSQLILGGQTLIERIAAELLPFASSVSLVGARENYPTFRNVADLRESWGALGGIHAAVSAAKTDWIAVIACDLPFVTTALFARLQSSASAAVDAVIPIQPDGRPQPVCAHYCPSTCLPEIEKLIAAGEHTPRALLANVRTRYVDFDELKDLPGAEHFFFNVNTPEEFAEAHALVNESSNL